MLTQAFINFVKERLNPNEQNTFAGYLGYFAPELKNEFIMEFPNTTTAAWYPEETNTIVQPITFFQSFGMSIKMILDSSLWDSFFLGLLEKEAASMVMSLGEFRSKKNELLLVRACYRYGKPIMDDATYDIILEWYTATYPDLVQFKERSYDDDEYNSVMQMFLETFQIITENKMVADEEIKKSLDQEKSTSILPVTDPKEVYDFLMGHGFDKVLFSLKLDGVNTKKGYRNGEFAAGLSRGRSSAGLDYTETLNRVVPRKIPIDSQFVSVTSEAFVDEEYLEILRRKYPDKQFKTPKSSAISFLRNSSLYDEEDIKHLHVLSFDGEGIGVNKIEIYAKLQELGFEIPPNIIIEKEDIPTEYTEFSEWLENKILTPLKEIQERLKLPSDGVVCEKIGLDVSTRKDQYSDSSIAIKFSHWASGVYTSVVKNIIMEQKRVNASFVLEIDPVVTSDGNVATRVNGSSLSILVKHGIVVGSTINFMRKSSAYNVLVL